MAFFVMELRLQQTNMAMMESHHFFQWKMRFFIQMFFSFFWGGVKKACGVKVTEYH